MEYRYPVHNERRLRFGSPEGMKQVFLAFPLNNDFVDWVANQGFEIVYRDTWKAREGSVWWSLKKINVSSKGSPELSDLILMHELVHMGLSQNIILDGRSMDEREEYERAIDEIARHHLKDKELLAYIKEKLPSNHYDD